jgi:ABC-2 type transport system ATP-binding protein
MNKELTPVVSVNNIVKSFKIPLEGSSGLKQKLINQLRGRKGYRVFTPLNDISFTVNKGDFFGIVGKNGSGKSTILKQEGSVEVVGSLVPFIELGVGFNPELTGRENVYLNGALLGFSRKEIDLMYDDIVSFAELSDFMDERLKNYSSGMQVRLAFSIAIKAQGDILLLDEVLAVGDAAFQQKCYDYFEDLKKKRKTVILVTHDMAAVKRFCNRAILIEEGKIKLAGSPEEVADAYIIDNFDGVEKESEDGETTNPESESASKLHLKLHNKKVVLPGETLEFDVEYTLEKALEPEIRIAIEKDGISFGHVNTRDLTLPSNIGTYTATIKMDTKDLLEGIHYIYWGVYDKGTGKQLAFVNKAASFFIKRHAPTKYGLMYVDVEWSKFKLSKGK